MKILVALFVTVMMISCDDPAQLEKTADQSILFEHVLKSSNKLYEQDLDSRTEPRTFIFNSAHTLNSYLETKIGDEEIFELLRSTDFNTYSLVAVDLPAQTTGFIQVKITSIVLSGNILKLSAERLVPGNHAVTDDIGYPVNVVLIEKSSATVELAEMVDVVSDLEG